ncbi:MAG: chromosomal replication initiator protein DnaA [Eubacteriaceae bacterium]|nr:chromosomal replication initiator protein DnaA [Eubacteriaceae bacterium]
MEIILSHWDRAKMYIKEELTPVVFSEYIEPLIPLHFDDENFVLKVDEEYKISLIEQQYHFLILKSMRFVTGGKSINIRYVLDPSDYSEAAMTTAPENAAEPEILEDSASMPDLMGQDSGEGFSSKYTFESFVVGSNNRLAHAAAVAVAQNPGKKYNPLFIYGGVGLGKTHLMHAIAQQVLKTNPGFKVSFVSSEKFTNEFIDAIRKESNIQFRYKYRSIDMLLVDDIQFLSGKEGTQEEFFHTFNDLYGSGSQIIMTSDKPPKDIPGFEERLRSRFEWGLSCDITPPNFETRVAILRKKAEEEKFAVSDDILEIIARQVESNIRELEGMLTKVKIMQQLQTAPITLEQVEISLGATVDPPAKPISIDIIIQTTARNYSVSFGDIVGQKRTNVIAEARQIAMYFARTHTELSLQAIGNAFGGRDYSTVIHACTKIKQKVQRSPEFKNTLDEIFEEILNRS